MEINLREDSPLTKASLLRKFLQMLTRALDLEIARRYFALNLFDGILTVLGFTVNYFFLGGRSPSVLLASGLIISMGMAISGLTSAMLVEYSELQKELIELEKALFRDLDGTHIAKAKMATALMNALVNAVAPILGALAVLFPILLSSVGLIGFSQGFMLSLLLSMLSLFLLGVYLGKNAGSRPIVYGFIMVLAGSATAIIAYLLGAV
ncbi:VIT1/CCC1 transporter family protein [Thermofilum sp.]|jgi:predicted membrane protein (TIGR00267 family)|uniref:VIT1/CCC1 transporter family protein n=1 Tax=Thermofilum sp. TaxID=1961369 RepID=UPI0025869088|nr:VIT1/CCC1 transporter family protein [Thermofilum sp.]